MNDKITIDRGQYAAISAVADGAKAEVEYLSNHKPEVDDTDDKHAMEAIELLEYAKIDTPVFLRGVLLSDSAYGRVLHILELLNDEVKRGRRWEAIADNGIKGGQAMIGGILVSMLKQTTDALDVAKKG